MDIGAASALASRRDAIQAASPQAESSRDALRVRRPYAEMRAGDAVALAKVAAELLVQPCVGAFLEQIDVVVGQQDCSPIGLPPAPPPCGKPPNGNTDRPRRGRLAFVRLAAVGRRLGALAHAVVAQDAGHAQAVIGKHAVAAARLRQTVAFEAAPVFYRFLVAPVR